MPSSYLIQSSTSYQIHSSDGSECSLILDADRNALSTIWIESRDGEGMAPLHRLSERGPAQHGVTDRGFRLDPRTITHVYGIQAATYADLLNATDYFLARVVPTDTALSLMHVRENSTTRQIDVFVSAPPMLSTKDRQGFHQKIAVSYIAPDPLWYDPTQVAETFGASGAGTGMAIPWLIPWKLGASNINQSRTLTYMGTFQTSPVVRIVGPITDAVVTNSSSPNADKLDFTGTTIANGAYYTIDCVNKTVLDSSGTNQISKLTTDSDLSTFALHPHPVVAGGANTITVAGTGISSVTQVYFTYYTRYVGM